MRPRSGRAKHFVQRVCTIVMPQSKEPLLAYAVVVVAVLAWWLTARGQAPKGDLFIDPATKIGFAPMHGQLGLLGVGVRTKRIGPIHVNVYSVALYGSPPRRGDPVAALRDSGGDRSLLLVFARSVRGPAVVDALASVTAPDEARRRFRDVMLDLIGHAVSRGDTLGLSCPPRARHLTVHLRHRTARIPHVCDAVFDRFLGRRDAVSPALLDSIRTTHRHVP